jgi:hypothetical protein
MNNKVEVVVFDLDGCISDDRHRRHLYPYGADEDYKPYHDAAWKDPAMNKNIVLEHIMAGRALLFVTARPVSYTATTCSWLNQNFPALNTWDVLMRPEHNRMPSPDLKIHLLEQGRDTWDRVLVAYDDREDVLKAYSEYGIPTCHLSYPMTVHPARDAPDVLRAMADTYEKRNAVYGSNWQQVAPVMKALFPVGIPDNLVFQNHWHLFELIIVKLTRFANSGLEHADSIHDAAVYAALIETILENDDE